MTLVCLEIGKKRVFASALEWPGWARSGRGEAEALDALATYADRYAEVVDVAQTADMGEVAGTVDPVDVAGLAMPDPAAGFVVAERLAGDMTTDFGAPGAIAEWERRPLQQAEAERLASLMRAGWAVLDRVVALTPPELRKGPRGGGRDRDAMVGHVLGAEVAYARKIGVRHRQPAHDDAAATAALRDDLARAVIGAGDASQTPWPVRYAVRRIAWHVLDHAWEMQDRTGQA